MIFNKFLFKTDPIIAIVFWILMLVSVISWYFIFNKINTYRKLKQILNSLLSQEKIQKKDLEYLLFIFPPNFNISHSYTKSSFLLKKYIEFGLVSLASIGSSAPFIGLFGTVWGIYFALIDISKAGNASIDVVAAPMGEALIATSFGLFAAIPAVISFNFFKKSGNDIYKGFNLILLES